MGLKNFLWKMFVLKMGKESGEWDFIVYFDRALILFNKTTNTVHN